MKLLPVVARELRVIARRPSAYWVRSGAALAAFLAMGYVALVGAAGLPTANQGRSLFDLLSMGTFLFCALAGIRGTSDALSQEKREGTLGLLFLTDLKGYDVVFGKLASVSINSVYGVLAVAPPLALAFMMGGTSALQFLLMVVLLFNTLFFSLAAGILVSTFSEQERPAMGATLAVVFLTLAMPYAIAAAHSYGLLEIWEVMEPGFLLTSPAFAYWTIKSATMLRIHLDDVLASLTFTHLAGWLCLVVASASVAQRAHADAPQGRLGTWLARVRQEWAYGKATRRRGIRGTLLDRNAFSWLAGRDRLKQRYAWIFLALFAGVGAVARWKAPEVTEEWPMAMFSLWFLHLFFKVWVASEVAARFIEDRRSNALELLLTTPLKLREMVSGQRLALVRQFGPPIALIAAMSVFVGWRAGDSSSYMIRTPNPLQFFAAGLIHLAFDLYAIQWVSMWRSMRLRGANRTIIQTILIIIFLPVFGWFMLWQASWVLSVATRGGGFSAAQILWVWTGLCVVFDLMLAAIARQAFYRDFREVATSTFAKPTPFRWKRTRAATMPAPEVVATKPPPLKWGRARKLAVGFAVVLVCFYAVVGVRRHRLEGRIEKHFTGLRQAGMPVLPEDVPRMRPGPGVRESGSVILRQASRAITTSSRPLYLTPSDAQWDSQERLPPELKRKLSAWITINSELFRTLEELPGRKPGGGTGRNRYGAVLQTEDLFRILQIKARVEMEDDPAAAARTISILLHCVRALQGEDIWTFVGTIKAMEGAKVLLERAAMQGNFAAEHWAAWKEVLQQMNPTAHLREHLIVERTEGIVVFSQPADALYQRFGRGMGLLPGMFNVGWSMRRFVGQDKKEMLDYLDYMDQFIADAEKPFWEVGGPRNFLSGRAPTVTSANFVTPQILPAFDWLHSSATELSAYQKILMSACDVEMFRAEHGKVPKDIVGVASLARLDPFSGNRLLFIMREDGYSIYSVGADRKDDGGVRRTARQAGDIAFHFGKAPERSRVVKKP